MRTHPTCAALAAALLALPAAPAPAAIFQLDYRGWLSAAETLTGRDGVDQITTDTPFRLVARFDTTSSNLVAPIPVPGFVAYAPLSARLTVAGQRFRVVGAAEEPAYGIGIAIFDQSNVFFPGAYGVGFIANPLEDGAGIVGHFKAATPDFSVTALTETTFGRFEGAGYLAGIGCAPPDPRPCVPQPIALVGAGGAAWLLGFENGDRTGGFTHTATLAQVPAPPMLALFGLVAAAAMIRGKLSNGRSKLGVVHA